MRPRDTLLLLDKDGQRRTVIADHFKKDATALAALDALGGKEFSPPPIDRDAMFAFQQRHVDWTALNHLAGIHPIIPIGKRVERDALSHLVRMPLPVKKTAERDRIVILWLLYDLFLRAQFLPRRIKMEQLLRESAVRKTGELAMLDRLGALYERAAAIADESEAVRGQKDSIRPPPGAHEKMLAHSRLFLPEQKPIWCSLYGVSWRTGDREALKEAGRHSALGALAVIVPALLGRRRDVDPWLARAATALFGVKTDKKEVSYHRAMFLEQRGFRETSQPATSEN
jgi:hypothetical protein